MYTLRLFGTAHLEGPQGNVPTPGPRRLALLASLAAAGAAGLTRDKLVSRLWPEDDDTRARAKLSQLLYALRTELGTDLIEGTSTLRIDPAQCRSDVAEFDAALAERRDADAVALYVGPFLDGFHLSDNAEFSQWMDPERSRRESAVRAASIRVAEAVPDADTPASALAWARAVALDPHSGKLVLRSMDAHVANGDRSAALRVAEQYAGRVRAELESEPDAAVVRRADQLRQLAGGVTAPLPGTEAALGGPTTAPPVLTATAPGPPPVSGPRRRTGRALALGTVALAAVATAFAWKSRQSTALTNNEYVILAEFENNTTDSLLSGTVSTAVSAALQQSSTIVPLPPTRVSSALRRMERPDTLRRLGVDLAREVAVREGVRFVLTGEVIALSGERQLISRIIEAGSGRAVRTRTFRASSDAEILPAIDRLAAQMRRDLGEASSSIAQARPLPEVTTASLAALSAFSNAKEADYVDDLPLEISFLQRAVRLDSSFASAHAELGRIYNQNNDLPRASFHFTRALAQLDRLPVVEALRIQTSAAFARGDMAHAAELSRQLVALRPRDATSWALLGFYRYASGDHSGSRAAYSVADSMAPLTPPNLLNVGNTWFAEARAVNDRARFDSARVYYARAIAATPALAFNGFYNHQYGTILLGARQPDSAAAVFDGMMARGPADRARGLRSNAYLDAVEGRWRRAADRMSEAAALTARIRESSTSTARNLALLAEIRFALGEREAARRALGQATAIALRDPLETRALAFIAHALVNEGDRSNAQRVLGRMRAAARPEFAAEQSVIHAVEGALLLAEGKPTAALPVLRSAIEIDSTRLQTRIAYARALAAAGQDSAADAAWERIGEALEFGLEGQVEWQFSDYERGRSLERLGRVERAIAIYRRQLQRQPQITGEPEPLALRATKERLRALEAPR
ncbi:MAG: hypothetical protein K8S21_09405 [Gemmatimonadetes bacterium]|nr:hypothetical protein [Gemmatimonadota bacterium]